MAGSQGERIREQFDEQLVVAKRELTQELGARAASATLSERHADEYATTMAYAQIATEQLTAHGATPTTGVHLCRYIFWSDEEAEARAAAEAEPTVWVVEHFRERMGGHLPADLIVCLDQSGNLDVYNQSGIPTKIAPSSSGSAPSVIDVDRRVRRYDVGSAQTLFRQPERQIVFERRLQQALVRLVASATISQT